MPKCDLCENNKVYARYMILGKCQRICGGYRRGKNVNRKCLAVDG